MLSAASTDANSHVSRTITSGSQPSVSAEQLGSAERANSPAKTSSKTIRARPRCRGRGATRDQTSFIIGLVGLADGREGKTGALDVRSGRGRRGDEDLVPRGDTGMGERHQRADVPGAACRGEEDAHTGRETARPRAAFPRVTPADPLARGRARAAC